jgi:tRNA G46 methylase TrmB
MSQNDALMPLVKRYLTESGEKSKQTMEAILALPNAPRRIYGMIIGEDQRAALKALADIAKKKLGQEELAPLVIADADKLMTIDDDKARKSAYKIIGLCAPDACADKLFEALKREKTQFVRPSIILALGNTKQPERYLKNYVVEPGEPKHMQAEQDALKKALGKAAVPQQVPMKLRLPEWCTLTSIKPSALAAELKAKGADYRPSRLRDAFEAPTAYINKLRCFEDALFYVGKDGDYKAAADALNAIGCKGQFYRIEAGAVRPEKRREAIMAVSKGLAPYGYTDNPSAYAFELRLIKGNLYAKFADHRFDYRKTSISASINPVTAASIMRLCEPYMSKDADVLDPFCGSGTMLIERAYLKPAKSLVGVDISGHAIKAACTNRRASGLRIALIHGDILGYGAAQYDEVIANMPFGIRVSGHTSNLKLYAGFADKLLELLRDGGYAFLLTQEKKLLREEIGKRQALSLIHEENFESGGLCPTLFIITKTDKHY